MQPRLEGNCYQGSREAIVACTRFLFPYVGRHAFDEVRETVLGMPEKVDCRFVKGTTSAGKDRECGLEKNFVEIFSLLCDDSDDFWDLKATVHFLTTCVLNRW